jgi:hypothetical protein
MPADNGRAVPEQDDNEDVLLADSSARFVEMVVEVYRLLGFEVLQEILLRGMPIGLAVAYTGGGLRLPAVVLCQDRHVTESACTHILACHSLVQQQFPDHRVLVVSSQGFTAESGVALKAAGIACVTSSELLAEFAPLERYVAGLIADYEAWVREHWYDEDWFIRPMVWTDVTAEPCAALEYLSHWCSDPGVNRLLLLGDSGTGKTTLMRFFAYDLARRFRDDPYAIPPQCSSPSKMCAKRLRSRVCSSATSAAVACLT